MAKAFELYAQAADQGYSSARFNLAYCYQHGEGVAKDMAKAVDGAAPQPHGRDVAAKGAGQACGLMTGKAGPQVVGQQRRPHT